MVNEKCLHPKKPLYEDSGEGWDDLSMWFTFLSMENAAKTAFAENKQYHVWLIFHSQPHFSQVYCKKHWLRLLNNC